MLIILFIGIYIYNNYSRVPKNSHDASGGYPNVLRKDMHVYSYLDHSGIRHNINIRKYTLASHIWSIDEAPARGIVLIGCKGGNIYSYEINADRITLNDVHPIFYGNVSYSNINDISIAPDESLFVTACGNDNTAIIWKLDSMQPFHILKESSRQIINAKFVWPGTNLIVTTIDRKVREYGARSGNLIGERHFEGNGALKIASARFYAGIVLFDRRSIYYGIGGGKYKIMPVELKANISAIAVHPSKEIFAIAYESGTIDVYEYSANAFKYNGAHNIMNGKDIRAMDFSPSGEYIVAGGQEGMVSIWSVKDKEVIYTYRIGQMYVNTVRYSHTNNVIYAGGNDCELYIIEDEYDLGK